MDWYTILYSAECSNCTAPIKRPVRGPARAFCARCTASLPDNIALHLDRARRQRWFIGWWRTAQRMLRQAELRRAA